MQYTPIYVAQINEALAAHAQEQDIVAGLTALKADIVNSIDDYKDCVQCSATGTIDNGATVCPLCEGQTVTSGQYKVDKIITGYSKV